MTEDMKFILALVGAAATGLGLLCIAIIMTIAFPKIRKIEKMISAATLNSSSGGNLWGGDPYGRLIRTTHIFCFLWMRHIPGHFRRAASNVGNVNVEISRSLFLWGFMPTLGLFLFGGTGMGIGLSL